MMRANSAAGRAASNRLVILERISGTLASFGFEFLLRQHTRIVLAPMCCFALNDSRAPASWARGGADGGGDARTDVRRGPTVSTLPAGRAGLRCRSDAGVP